MEMQGIAPGFGELPVPWWRRLIGEPEEYERNCCGSVDAGVMETQRKHALLRCGPGVGGCCLIV